MCAKKMIYPAQRSVSLHQTIYVDWLTSDEVAPDFLLDTVWNKIVPKQFRTTISFWCSQKKEIEDSRKKIPSHGAQDHQQDLHSIPEGIYQHRSSFPQPVQRRNNVNYNECWTPQVQPAEAALTWKKTYLIAWLGTYANGFGVTEIYKIT